MANSLFAGMVGVVIGGAAVWFGPALLGNGQMMPTVADAGYGEMAMPHDGTDGHQDGDSTAPAAPEDAPPASQANLSAMATMMADMAISYSGDADADYFRGMIPHHQAAADTSRAVLEYGTDPLVRDFAQRVIAAQVGEIAEMQIWLEAHDH